MRGEILLLSTALICLVHGTASWGQTDNPTASDLATQNTAGVTKKLPKCEEQLAVCKNTLKSTQRKLARCTTNFNTCTNDLQDCQTDLDACEEEPRVVLPGDGQTTTPAEQAVGIDHGPALRYTDNGDGTFTDNNTLLMWEKKDRVEGSIHHFGNGYQWSSNSIDPIEPDGSLFTVFLATLNTAPCFVGHCDWRIPNIRELQSLVDYSMARPATSIPGSNLVNQYWSSTTFVNSPSRYDAWVVLFESGFANTYGKSLSGPAIAVRGGQ